MRYSAEGSNLKSEGLRPRILVIYRLIASEHFQEAFKADSVT